MIQKPAFPAGFFGEELFKFDPSSILRISLKITNSTLAPAASSLVLAASASSFLASSSRVGGLSRPGSWLRPSLDRF